MTNCTSVEVKILIEGMYHSLIRLPEKKAQIQAMENK